MRYRTAASLVAFPADNSFVIYNFITKDVISCPVQEVYWLTCMPNWITMADILAGHPELEPQAIKNSLDSFAENNMLLLEGSAAAKADERYRAMWQLGPSAALFHFTTMDCEFMDADTSTQWQAEKRDKEPEPPAFWRNGISSHKFSSATHPLEKKLMTLMARRRSVRQVTQQPLTQGQIGNILFSGLGITGWTKTETLEVPLKMTPSGGARNPYEAYVWVRNSDDLKQGIYHYSAFDNAVSWLSQSPDALPSTMLQAQAWADDMPLVIFLVAIFERTTWKYQDDNAYKVVLIEAGHIAQNMMLMATAQQLTICPTAALNHSLIATTLGLDGITHFPVYCLLVGQPSAQGIQQSAPLPYMIDDKAKSIGGHVTNNKTI